jgi:serralysin
VTGGLGPDLFHTFGGAGRDYVVDFNQAEGDRVMLDPGTIYALAQVGADTIINMDGGGQMILAGVELSTLTADWIFAG